MSGNGTPILDARAAEDFYAELTARQPAFTPELPPVPLGSAAALRQILARFSSTVTQRLDQAPDLDKLAFLQMLGISLIPAQPARAPLVFQPLPMTVDGHIPAGTRAGASAPGVTRPTVFETENDIAMTAAQLIQVVSLWPDQDGFIDHSADLAGARRFTLFQAPTPVEHVLYLAQHTLLAFKGKSTVEIRFDLAINGSKAVTFRWEFWDGSTWRSFRDFDATDPAASNDATLGLTRSGIVSLQADCGDSAQTSVSNIANYWVRGRLTAPLPPDPARTFAIARSMSLRTTIDRSLTHDPGGSGCKGPAQIDAAYAGTAPLDLTKIFYPLGKAPGTDAAFYLISQEIFSKPGAKVTVCIDRATTPEEEANANGPSFAAEVTQAQKDLVAAVQDVANSAIDTTEFLNNLFSGDHTAAAQTAIGALQTAVGTLTDAAGIAGLSKVFHDLINAGDQVGDSGFAISTGGGTTKITINSGQATGMQNARNADFTALADAYDKLSKITAIAAAGAGGSSPPTLAPPRLVWEYSNGTEWLPLVGPVNDDATNLMASGEFSFVVPQDIAPFMQSGSPVLGMRARLASGSYYALLLISWTDPSSGQTNVIPVLQPRPPALNDIAIGYVYRSPWTSPDESLTWNDFLVESHTPTAATPAANFSPYHPMADSLPTLYLGFDKPLPNDYLSMFFDIEESDTDGAPLVWEAWSGDTWQTLAVSDDTGALARSGMVAFLDPGAAPRPTANIASASGSVVTTTDALAAAVFRPGDQIVLQPDKAAELVTVDSISGPSLALKTPLGGTYTNTAAVRAALPRFGTSLDWVRARQKSDGVPGFSQVNGIYPNAVWARQVQTITNETLGSGTGQPSQSLFFQQFPVAEGAQVQVRELVGAQATVEFLVLQDELAAQGFASTGIRTVIDARSGLITEVWVSWIEQPNFFFSGPDDRHYMLDRASGRIVFGNGINGKLPTAGNSNIMAYQYRAGGGLAGNVAAGAIHQLLGGAVARSVTNPAAAEGGADTEPATKVAWRGPQVLRHRGSALAAEDYEALALEASPGVAITRCLPATSANLRAAPGYVTLILVPRSLDPQPKPSYELKQQVMAYLAERAPASIESGRITVIAPNYMLVGVSATVAPKQLGQSAMVKSAVEAALNLFFHPLQGGPDGRGWPFGRSVYLSDVARLVEGIDGVDYVQQLELLRDLIPCGDVVLVPTQRLVAAGPMLIVMDV